MNSGHERKSVHIAIIVFTLMSSIFMVPAKLRHVQVVYMSMSSAVDGWKRASSTLIGSEISALRV